MQILFDGQRAAGVAFQHDGQQKTAEATSEVILAAGTVGTTKLLLLSGVGPRNHLQSLKVTHCSQHFTHDDLFSRTPLFTCSNSVRNEIAKIHSKNSKRKKAFKKEKKKDNIVSDRMLKCGKSSLLQ